MEKQYKFPLNSAKFHAFLKTWGLKYMRPTITAKHGEEKIRTKPNGYICNRQNVEFVISKFCNMNRTLESYLEIDSLDNGTEDLPEVPCDKCGQLGDHKKECNLNNWNNIGLYNL